MTQVLSSPSPPVLTLAELCQRALGIGGFTSKPIHGITDDSRRVRPGWLYTAIRGTQVDGHDFVSAAIAAGAVAVVVERPVAAPPGVVELIVRDSRIALARLMATWTGLDRLQADRRLRVAGITGTNGKSTTVFMIRALLNSAGLKTAMLGTILYDLIARQLPSPLTTPAAVTLSEYLVESARAGARFAAMEVSSIALHQRRVDGIHFETAIFSNLTGDHLDYHHTMEAYFQVKKRFFDTLQAGATAVVNVDDPRGEAIVADCPAGVLRYGFDDRADLRAEIIESGPRGSRFRLHHRDTTIDMSTPLVGRHNVYNAMAAAGATLTLGLDLEAVRRGLVELRRVPGRLERVDLPDTDLDVFVDYAHTDDALDNVLRSVKPMARGRLWCVFGCGGDRDATKRPRMGAVAARLADCLVITSDNPRSEDPDSIIGQILVGLPPDARDRAIVERDRAAAITRAVREASPGDTLVIAGKGHENHQIIGAVQTHFDDVEVARTALKLRSGAA